MRLQELFEDTTPVSKAKAWIEKVYNLYPHTFQNNHVMSWGEGENQQFSMFELTPSFSKRGAVEVKWFQAYPLRQGVGSRAMAELQRLAKEDGITLTLFPWDKGQVSQAKLLKFYKKSGFSPIAKGSKSMIWNNEVAEGKVKNAMIDGTYPAAKDDVAPAVKYRMYVDGKLWQNKGVPVEFYNKPHLKAAVDKLRAKGKEVRIFQIPPRTIE